MKVLILAEYRNLDLVYPAHVLAKMPDGAEVLGEPMDSNDTDGIAPFAGDVEVILSTWGAPVLDEAFLDSMPNLRAVLYGAGSVKGFVRDCVWGRGIRICSSWGVNAIPVAEMTIAQIILSLKRVHALSRWVREAHRFPIQGERPYIPSLKRSTVGLVSFGKIGQAVRERLGHLDLNVLVYDPYLSEAKASEFNVRCVELNELFEQSDVVSLHTPWLPETEGIIRGEHFRLMKTGATLINTSRGAIINESEMIEVLHKRSDIDVLLDVTWPEPPEPGSPLYTLPNVFLTPHIAGSVGRECELMGEAMLEELGRLIRGEPLEREVTRSMVATMA